MYLYCTVRLSPQLGIRSHVQGAVHTAKREGSKIHSKATIKEMYGQRENVNIQKTLQEQKNHILLWSVL